MDFLKWSARKDKTIQNHLELTIDLPIVFIPGQSVGRWKNRREIRRLVPHGETNNCPYTTHVLAWSSERCVPPTLILVSVLLLPTHGRTRDFPDLRHDEHNVFGDPSGRCQMGRLQRNHLFWDVCTGLAKGKVLKSVSSHPHLPFPDVLGAIV